MQDYGSQNQEEESAFIRRVVAPPKRNDKSRRRQKRMAAVGASVVLLAAGAVATYVTMPGENASSVSSSETLEVEAKSFTIPVNDDEPLDGEENYVPPFTDYDTNGDGAVSSSEYLAQLAAQRDDALQRIAEGDISAAEKADYSGRVKRNFDKEVSCVQRLASRDKANNGAVTEDRFPLFYNMIKEFCIIEDVKIPPPYRPTDVPPTEAPTPEPETPSPTKEHQETEPPSPTYEPTVEPTVEPTREPTYEPTVEPTHEPTVEPTREPTYEPTIEPTVEPTYEPTYEPTVEPTREPTREPTYEPTWEPTVEPTGEPTYEPTIEPTFEPTVEPTREPTYEPTVEPTREPTYEPTYEPTVEPTYEPTAEPTWKPLPTDSPTVNPDRLYMTKPEFRTKIANHFEGKAAELAQHLEYAALEYKKAQLLKNLLEECINQAADKFGYYGIYEQDEVFNDAVTWIVNDCLTT